VRRAVGQEIAALPAKAVVGFIKVSAKPLKASLSTWASKWVYLFTHYLQVMPLFKHVMPWHQYHIDATVCCLAQWMACILHILHKPSLALGMARHIIAAPWHAC
jgi:hypothetical protein